MKNFKVILLAFSVFFAFTLFFVSCSKDGEIETMAQIVVKKDGTAQSGLRVYIFSDPPTEAIGRNPVNSKQSKDTNEHGIVTFLLKEGIELHGIKDETRLYFTVLEKTADEEYTVLGSIQADIKTGGYFLSDLEIE